MKVAVIGAGYWGKNLVRNFSELNALHAVCDSDQEKLNQIKKIYPSVHLASSYREILDNKEIGAVAIATPALTHYQLAKECILRGKDVFVEKPISFNVDEGMELIALSEQKREILMVGHLLEYHPGILKLKELIDKGELGNIYYIYSNRVNLGKVRREENILWSFAPHDISVMILLLNQMPIAVSTHAGNYLHRDIADVTVTNLEFKNGVKGHIFVSWLHPYKEQKLIIVGDKKMALFDDVTEKDKLLLYGHKIKWVGNMPVSVNKAAQVVDFSASEPLREECKHFLECINTRKKPKTDGYNGVRVLKVLWSCQQSLERNGEEVRLDSNPSGSNNFYSHPTATIDKPCKIGERTKIWHYSHIMESAAIGKDCQIGQNVFVGKDAKIGNGVKIQNNVSIYDRVTIEDNVFCGPSCVFTNVINPRSFIPRKKEFKKTIVKKGATIGANATIVCGNTIGRYAFIGAGAVVNKDVVDYGLVVGVPGRQIGWVCRCGVTLKEFNKEKRVKCKACGSAYKLQGNRNQLIALKEMT